MNFGPGQRAWSPATGSTSSWRRQGGEPVLEPLPTPPTIGGQQEEHLFVDVPVQDVGRGVDVEAGTEVSGLRQVLGQPTLVAAAGATALGEQGGHFGFGGGSPHDVVDRRSTGDDGGRMRGKETHCGLGHRCRAELVDPRLLDDRSPGGPGDRGVEHGGEHARLRAEQE